MIEVYVDDYINLAMARSRRDLDHTSDATMHGIYSVFLANKVNNKDPISEKKMTSGGSRRMFLAERLKD